MNISTKATLKISLITMFLLGLAFGLLYFMPENQVSADNNWIIDGNRVYVDDSKVYISVEPHTLHSSGWIYLNFTSKVYTGDIDMVWGFNTKEVRPKKAELYHPHNVSWETTHSKIFYNMSGYSDTTEPCEYGYEYNTYKKLITYTQLDGFDNQTNETIWSITTAVVCFDSYEDLGNNDYKITWHQEHTRTENWLDVSDRFESVNYEFGDMDKWYYITNIPIEKNVQYTMRAYIEIPVWKHTSGKYWVAFKPSSESLHQAVQNGHLYYLDPWWNSNWQYRRNFTVSLSSFGYNVVDFPVEVQLNCYGKCLNDGKDIRVVNSTGDEIPFGLKVISDGVFNITWRVDVNDNSNINTTIYYGNGTIVNYANTTWDDIRYWIEDFEDGDFLDGGLTNFDNGESWSNTSLAYIVSDPVKEGTYAIELTTPGVNNYVDFNITYPVEFDYFATYLRSTNAYEYTIFDALDIETAHWGAYVCRINKDDLEYYDDGSTVDIQTAYDNTWYKYEYYNISYLTQTADIWINNVHKVFNHDVWMDDSVAKYHTGVIRLYCNKNNGECYFDYLKMRPNINSTYLTITEGSEETANQPPEINYNGVTQYTPANSTQYPVTPTFEANITDPDDDYLYVYLYYNGMQINATGTNTTTYKYSVTTPTLGAGMWNITWEAYDGTNTTTDTFWYEVSKASSEIALYINGSRANYSTTNKTAINLTADLITPDIAGTVYIYRNDTLWDSGASPLYNITENWSVGSYEVKANWSGNENYTSDKEIWYITIEATPPSFSNWQQQPPDLNSSSLGKLYINVTITDDSGVNESSVKFYHWINDSQYPDEAWCFINGTAGDFEHEHEMTNITSSIFNITLHTYAYNPSTHNVHPDIMRSATKYNYSLNSNNKALKIRFYNISTHPNTTYILKPRLYRNSGNLLIYYCNESYTIGKVYNSDYCVPLTTLTSQAGTTYQNTYFYGDENSYLDGVKITSTGYIIFYALPGSDWEVAYANIDSNSVETTGNGGTTWTNQDFSADTWLIQLNGNGLTTVGYKVYACDMLGNCDNSTVQEDTYAIHNLAPSPAPKITVPENDTYKGTFNITWEPSKDPNNDPFNYSLYLFYSNGTLADVLADNNITEGTEYYTFDSTNYPDGQYYLIANATDNESNTNFYIMPYLFTIDQSATTSTTSTSTSVSTTSTSTTTTIIAGNPPEITIHEPNMDINNVQSTDSITDDTYTGGVGNETILYAYSGTKEVYYEIDFNDIEDMGKIKNGTFSFYESEYGGILGTIYVYYCNDVFSETDFDSITSCSLLTSLSQNIGWKTVTLTNKLIDEFNDDRRFTLKITVSNTENIGFNSKEASSNKPYLVMNYYNLATNKTNLNFTVTDDYTEELPCWYSINGSSETYMGYFLNDTESTYLMNVPNVNNLHNLTVKCSDTLQNSTNSTEFYSVYPYAEIRAYDEDTVENIFFNVTISNDTTSQSFEESYQNGFSKFLSDLPIGDVTIKVESEDYEPRFYYDTFDAHEKINAYLLKTSDGLTYTFYILTLGGMPIENATINISTVVNGTSTKILSALTNPDGSASAFLEPNKEYSFSAEAEGYETKYFNMIMNPDVRNVYIRLLTSAEIEEVQTPFSNTTYSILPTEQYQNESFVIHFIVNSNVTLDYFGMNIYYVNTTTGNSTLVYNYTVNNTLGGDLSYTTDNVTGRWDVNVFIKHPDFAEWSTTKSFYIGYSPTFDVSILSGFGYWIIAVIISILVTGFFSKFVGVGAGFIGLSILAMFMLINPVSLNVGGVLISGWYVIILSGIVYAVIVFVKSYI